MSQGSLDPKIRFIGQKVCSVARVQTDRHTDRQTHRQTRKWIQRTPFQGFRNFSFNLSSRIGPILIQKSIFKIHCRNYFTFRHYVWLYCATYMLGCGGGGEAKVSQHPVYISRSFFFNNYDGNTEIEIRTPLIQGVNFLKGLKSFLGDLWINGTCVYWYNHGMWPIILLAFS